MVTKDCGKDCAGACSARGCHYLRELDDGRVVTVSCAGSCYGRCVGRLEVPSGAVTLAPAPDGGARAGQDTRATVRSKELYWEDGPETPANKAETFRASCLVACIVGHNVEGEGGRGECLGACLGMCEGVATVQELVAAPPYKYPAKKIK